MSVETLIRQKSDLVSYIETHNLTTLERSGSTIRGTCPICHGDNDTEFVVNEKMFHCHKCKAGGNIINFVQQFYCVSYYMAIEQLADELNIDLGGSEEYKAEKDLVKENERVASQCRASLSKIIDYLKKERGLNDETITTFDLGCSPNGSVFIPIHDLYGRMVARSLRQFNTKPKYKNSKNNSLFEKASTLFNFHRARRLLFNTLYVCEGFFDAIVGHQQGLPTVAYLGSELTKSQINLIRDTCVNPETTVVICADNDEAGLTSIKRTRVNFKNLAPAISVRVLIFPIEKYEFIDASTGDVDVRVCKDLNDLHIQGLSIADCTTKHIDQYCLEEILNKCPDKQAEYVAVGEFIKSVTNPMIRNDIAIYLSSRWSQDLADIKRWFLVVDNPTDSLDIFISPIEAMRRCEEELLSGSFRLGFRTLDESLGCFRKKDVILIGAYPSTGKTFLAGQIILNLILNYKFRVLFFSLEMSAGALMERLAATLLGISTVDLANRIRDGKLIDAYSKIEAMLEPYLRIVDLTGLTIEDIDRVIKQANMTQFSQPVDCIVIDYLQIMGGRSTFDEKEACASGLKPLAKTNNLLTICLSQLTRGENAWEAPRMNMLKGGGANEAVGDFILMLHKKTENPKISLPDKIKFDDTITVSIEKGRRGYSTKDVTLKIDKNRTLIYEPDIPIV